MTVLRIAIVVLTCACAVAATGATTAFGYADCRTHLQTYLANEPHPPGAQRPYCDNDGTYSAKQCRGSGCYCANPDGTEIGYFTNYGSGAQNMNCNCARAKAAYERKNIIGRMFFCETNGNYRSVQCEGSVCFCVDSNGVERGNQRVAIGASNQLNC